MLVGAGELAHEQVGVEEKDDERDLDHCAPERLEFMRVMWRLWHAPMLSHGVRCLIRLREMAIPNNSLPAGWRGPRWAGTCW